MLNDQEKKRRRRFVRREKKKFLNDVKKVAETKQIFDKNIPLLDQIKNELGEVEFTKLCQHKQQIDEFDAPKNKNENFKIKREKNTNRNAIIEVGLNAQLKKNEEPKDNISTEDETLKKLFPKANKLSDMYETFDEYEENLEILDLLQKNQKEEEDEEKSENEEEKSVKYKELEDNVIIHEYE